MARPGIERTCVLIKPDGVARKLMGEIIRKLLNGKRRLKIAYLKLIRPTKTEIDAFLPQSRHWKRKVGRRAIERFREKGIDPFEVFGTEDPCRVAAFIRDNNLQYYRMGPSLGLIIEGPDAIKLVRRICGSTSPIRAEPGTIRGD